MKRKKLGATLLALFLAFALLPGMMPLQASAATSSEIRNQIKEMEKEQDELEAKIKELQGQYNAAENEMIDMVNQKDLIDQEIALLHTQVDLINDQIASYSLLIADKQDELDEAKVRLEELNRKNKERIQAMEEEGEISYWSIVFEANSFSDLLDRLNMIQEIAASDRRRMKELSAAAEEVKTVQASLEEEKASLEATKLELGDAQERLAEKRAEADELLRQLIAKAEEYEAMLDESEALQEELMAEIAAKEKEYDQAKHREWLATSVPPTTRPSNDRAPSNAPPSSSGWVSPLPYLNVTSPFGMRVHPVLGYARMHNGVDFGAAQGTPIYASRSGRVTVASYQAGGAGNYFSINHGDGFSSVYMHMTRYVVSVGQYVNAGQVIGYVGSTGISTGPHLHFGISYNGTYVNPMSYL